MSEYKIIIFWSEKDKAWIGTCPEFEGLAVIGETRQEAFIETEAAINDYIEIYKEDGIPLPEPATVPEHSGQVRLRMSRYVHQRAVELAEAEGLSLNSFLNGAVEARVGVSEYQQRLLDEISNKWAASTINLIQNQFAISAETVINLDSGDKPQLLGLGVANRTVALAIK